MAGKPPPPLQFNMKGGLIFVNNGIQVFENSDFGKVRVVERNGEPWFVAADVCTYFGVTNRNRIMQAVDAEDKGGTQMDTPVVFKLLL